MLLPAEDRASTFTVHYALMAACQESDEHLLDAEGPAASFVAPGKAQGLHGRRCRA